MLTHCVSHSVLCPQGAQAHTFAFWKNLCFNNSEDVGLKSSRIKNKWVLVFCTFILSTTEKLGNVVWCIFNRTYEARWNKLWCRYNKHLFSGSFCRQREIIFLKDLPYFFTISLSVTPVSRAGGSFCSVSINTWGQEEHIWLKSFKPSHLHPGKSKEQTWHLFCVINNTF